MDLSLNNLQWLMCYKTQPNQNQDFLSEVFFYKVYTYFCLDCEYFGKQ